MNADIRSYLLKKMIGVSELEGSHMVASSPADAIGQWHNAGGMVQYYDYPLDVYLNVSSKSASYPC